MSSRRWLRDVGRRRLPLVSPFLAGVTFVAMVSGCGSESDVLSGPAAGTKPSAMATASATPSPYPYADCDGLRAGDPLDFTNFVCAPEDVSQVGSMDCQSGTYVHLARPTGKNLEGIVGFTPTWREAAPIDPAYGRTPWAFKNCLEHE